jgi:hypothetical protein
MEQDKWIENVLNSANGIVKMEPNDLLFSKIEKQIKKNDRDSKSSLWLVAASITIFLSLSFIVFQLISFSSKENVSSLDEQFSINNQLYK